MGGDAWHDMDVLLTTNKSNKTAGVALSSTAGGFHLPLTLVVATRAGGGFRYSVLAFRTTSLCRAVERRKTLNGPDCPVRQPNLTPRPNNWQHMGGGDMAGSASAHTAMPRRAGTASLPGSS